MRLLLPVYSAVVPFISTISFCNVWDCCASSATALEACSIACSFQQKYGYLFVGDLERGT